MSNVWGVNVGVPRAFRSHRAGQTGFPSRCVTYFITSFCHVNSLLGFIVKVKKILESICVNCGKLKADIVSGVFFASTCFAPHHPNFLGALPTLGGEPQAHTAFGPR